MRPSPARLLLAALALLAFAAPPAAAAERYASPTGSSAAACSFAQPCAIESAINGAAAGDEVIVGQGTYTVTTAIDAPAAIDVHGVEAGPKPVLMGAETLLASVVSFKEGGTLRHLDIRANAPDADALTLGAGTAEALLLLSEHGDGAKVVGSAGATVLRDSVVVTRSTDPTGAGLKLRDGSGGQGGGVVALRNLTVHAPETIGIRCETNVGAASIVNVIARGAAVDLDATKAGARCSTSHSAYRPGAASPGISPAAGDVLAEPGFVDAPAGRLDLLAGSALVDTGAPADAYSGTKDALGRVRPLGGGIDIGAYEWTPEGVPAWPPPRPVKAPDQDATPTPTPAPAPAPKDGAKGKGTPPAHAPAHGLNGTQPGKTKEEGAGAKPVIGKSVVLAPAAGTVRFKAPGSKGYVELDGSSPVPSGSLVDTREGTVSLSSALDASGRTQTGRFRGALFVVRQSRTEKGMTELLLRGGDFGACRAAAARGATASAAAKRKPRRRLWSSDKGGKFRTQGRNSVATARGTAWLTEDTCAGTRVKVSEGAVEVRALRGARKPVLVKAGRQHLVRSRPR